MKIIHFLILLGFTFSCSKPLPDVKTLLSEADVIDWDQAVTSTIIINAPLESVWNYASNSNNAHDWSVFFDHISPLPGIPDGQVGSLRRCFREANETGGFWDEIVTEVIPLKRRQITTYNISNFTGDIIVRGQYVFVRQLYKSIDASTTEMTFQTAPGPQATLLGRFGFWLSKDDTLRIFKENLQNIKAMVEGQPRVHKWY